MRTVKECYDTYLDFYEKDLGAGRYRSSIRARETILVAPNAGSRIVRNAPHSVLFLAIAYRDLLALAGDDISLPADGNFGRLHAGPLTDPLIPLLLQRTWKMAEEPTPGSTLSRWCVHENGRRAAIQ